MPDKFRYNSDTATLVVDRITKYLDRDVVSLHVMERDDQDEDSTGRDIDGITLADLGVSSIDEVTTAVASAYVNGLAPSVAVEISTPQLVSDRAAAKAKAVADAKAAEAQTIAAEDVGTLVVGP